MANTKYDNLAVLLANGQLHWVSDIINAVLVKGVEFEGTDKLLTDALAEGGEQVDVVPVPARSVGPDGSLRGLPVSLTAQKDTEYQMLLVRAEYGGASDLLAFYDTDDQDLPLTVVNTGTLMLRPVQVNDPDQPTLGIWLTP